jgi:GT2 family glycosyltransferase
MVTSPPLTCAVMIATRNRRGDLARTGAVLRALRPAPDEVLICADGCTDDTVGMLRRDFPEFDVTVNDTGRGSTASRDALMRRSRCDLVLSLDDDSHPIEPDAIARIREIFERFPRVAVASFPQRTDEEPATLIATDFGPAHFAGTYVNCACAFRRATFLQLGGHFAPFWNAYDEPDFALRCADAGWQVRFDPSVTIRHHFSGVNRNHLRMHHLHARNEIWSVLMRCPAPQLIAVAAFRAWRQFGFAWKWSWRWVLREPQWWLDCLAGAGAALAQRRPVAWRNYRAWMRLVAQPLATEAEWKRNFGA